MSYQASTGEKHSNWTESLGGVPVGEEGPVTRKLASFPPLQSWVFGAWNEASIP